MKMLTIRALVVAAWAGLAFVVLAPGATADAVYHSQHIDLQPVGSSPLRSGFVENIHPNGPQVFAHEVYALNGVEPKTTYQVTLLIYPFDPGCLAGASGIPTARLTTNAAGNGRADFFIAPGDIPPVLRNATHGVRWTVTSAGSAYETACSAVTLD